MTGRGAKRARAHFEASRCSADVTMAGATQQPEVGWRVAAASASQENVIDLVRAVDYFLVATTRPPISCGYCLLHDLRQTPLIGLATPSTVWSFTQGERLITSASRRAHFFPRPDRLQPLQAIKQRAPRSRKPPPTKVSTRHVRKKTKTHAAAFIVFACRSQQSHPSPVARKCLRRLHLLRHRK